MDDGELASRILTFLEYIVENRERMEKLGGEPASGKGDLKEREERRRELAKAAVSAAEGSPGREFVLATLPLVKERLQGLLDWADRVSYLLEEGDLDYDPALLVDKKKTAEETAKALGTWAKEAGASPGFSTAELDELSRRCAGDLGWKIRPLFMALRIAVTGRKVSPPLFESMELLGRERTLARVASAVTRLEGLAD
jgi:glutamyl-tRNA synthetase